MSIQAEQMMMNSQPVQSHSGPYVSQQYQQVPPNYPQQIIYQQHPQQQYGNQQPYQQQIIIVQQQPYNIKQNEVQIQKMIKCFYWLNGILFVLVMINLIINFATPDSDTSTTIMILGDFVMLIAICIGISSVYRRQPQLVLMYILISGISTIISIISVIVGISGDDQADTIIGGFITIILVIVGQAALMRYASRIRRDLIAQKLQSQ